MKAIIFLAPPSAGKGTFAEYLKIKYNFESISTGNILRERALKDENLANLMKTGALISDEIILNIMKDKLATMKNDFILDGVPRTLNQAKILTNMLNELNIKFKVVYVNVDKDVLLNRVLGRATCPKCNRTYNLNIDAFKPLEDNICDDCKVSLVRREDDNEISFLKRLDEYNKNGEEVIKYYKSINNFNIIDNNSIDNTIAKNNLEEILNAD